MAAAPSPKEAAPVTAGVAPRGAWSLMTSSVAGAGELLARAWLALLVATVAVWGLSSLWLPYGWDHGCFGYLSDAILRGEMPYRDALDFKGPLTFYIFAALQLVFGRQMWAIRAFDLALLAGAGVAGVRLASQFISRRAAICTMLMLTLAFASFGNWYTAQPDGWAALMLVVVMFLLVRPEPVSLRNAALASMLIGACTLFKPLYVIFMALVAGALLPDLGELRDLQARGPALGRAIRGALAAAAGFLLPIVIAVAWFAARGALAAMIDVYIHYNLERATEVGTSRLSGVLAVTLSIPTSVPALAVALPAVALGAGYLTRERPRAGILLILWTVISLAAIGLQRKFFLHNYSWQPFFQAYGMLAGIGLAKLWTTTAPELRAGRWMVAVTAVVAFKLVAHEPFVGIGRWAKYVTGRTSLEAYRGTYDVNLFYGPGSDFGFSVPRDVKIAAYLDEHTAPTDEVIVWSDPLVNYLSGRRSMTPITVGHAFTTWGSEERKARYRAEFLTQLKGPKSAYFGIAARDLAPGTDEQNVPAHFPQLLEVLDAEYEVADRIGDVQMFKRRGR